MKTDVFKFCQHNFQKNENEKIELLREEGNINLELIIMVSYITGLMTCLLIYEVCKMMGLVGALM